MPEPCRVGLVGLGFAAWGLKIPSYLALDNVRIVAAADPRQEARREAAERLEIPEANLYADGHALLSRQDLDFIDVSTPHGTHADILIAAGEAGVPAICDKPVATSLLEADQVLGTFERAGLPGGVFRNFLAFPGWRKAIELIEAGAIGRPLQATLVATSIWAPGLQDGRSSGGLGWRPNTSVSGGGIFIDYGIHLIYLSRTLLGGGQPRRVTSHVGAVGVAAGDVEDRGTLVLEWEDGRRAVLDLSWGSGTSGGTTVQGTAGTLQLRYATGNSSPHNVANGVSVMQGRNEEDFHPVEWTRDPFDWYYRGSIEEFARRVGGDESSAAPTLLDGREDLEVVLAAYESAGLGRAVTLPLTASDPVYQRGAVGVHELDLPPDSVVLRHGLYTS
jgi:predicted dehydrogenase